MKSAYPPNTETPMPINHILKVQGFIDGSSSTIKISETSSRGVFGAFFLWLPFSPSLSEVMDLAIDFSSAKYSTLCVSPSFLVDMVSASAAPRGGGEPTRVDSILMY